VRIDIAVHTSPANASGKRLDGISGGSRAFLLTLLGGFGLARDGHDVRLTPRAQQLVALVALRDHLERSELAGTLWDLSSETRAQGCLRTELWRLNRRLPGLVRCDGRQVRLGGRVYVDVHHAVRCGRRLIDPTTTLHLRDLPDPWADEELLPGWDHDWLRLDRERLRQLRLHACEVAALRLSAMGHHPMALDCALAALRLEPMRESAYRTLISVHLAEGNLAEARRTFATCVDVLRRELGAAPTFSLELSDGRSRPCVAPGPGTPRWALLPAPAGPALGSR
jgi:DNA-binding SARP family transcriptional activator